MLEKLFSLTKTARPKVFQRPYSAIKPTINVGTTAISVKLRIFCSFFNCERQLKSMSFSRISYKIIISSATISSSRCSSAILFLPNYLQIWFCHRTLSYVNCHCSCYIIITTSKDPSRYFLPDVCHFCIFCLKIRHKFDFSIFCTITLEPLADFVHLRL